MTYFFTTQRKCSGVKGGKSCSLEIMTALVPISKIHPALGANFEQVKQTVKEILSISGIGCYFEDCRQSVLACDGGKVC